CAAPRVPDHCARWAPTARRGDAGSTGAWVCRAGVGRVGTALRIGPGPAALARRPSDILRARMVTGRTRYRANRGVRDAPDRSGTAPPQSLEPGIRAARDRARPRHDREIRPQPAAVQQA